MAMSAMVQVNAPGIVANYADIAHAMHEDPLIVMQVLDSALRVLVGDPNEATPAARGVWLTRVSRTSRPGPNVMATRS